MWWPHSLDIRITSCQSSLFSKSILGDVNWKYYLDKQCKSQFMTLWQNWGGESGASHLSNAPSSESWDYNAQACPWRDRQRAERSGLSQESLWKHFPASPQSRRGRIIRLVDPCRLTRVWGRKVSSIRRCWLLQQSNPACQEKSGLTKCSNQSRWAIPPL